MSAPLAPRFIGSLSVIAVTVSLAFSAQASGSHDHGHDHDHKHEHEHGHDHGHANEDAHRQHGAHVHGVASLNVAKSGEDLLIELVSPSANIVGFEYMPESEAEKAAIRDAVGTLENPATLFAIPAAAECALEEAHVDGAQLAYMGDDAHEGHDHGHEGHGHDDHKHDHDDHGHEGHGHDDHHGEDAHSEMEASYIFHCHAPAALTEITVNLFNSFPATEQITAQILSDTGQSAATLTAENATLQF